MQYGEAEVVDDSVVMIVLVRRDLDADAEAFEAQIKVRAHGAFDPGHEADVL